MCGYIYIYIYVCVIENTVLNRAGHERAICNKHSHMSYAYIKPEYSSDTTFIENYLRSYKSQCNYAMSSTTIQQNASKLIDLIPHILRY
jgi:hypothetical protein